MSCVPFSFSPFSFSNDVQEKGVNFLVHKMASSILVLSAMLVFDIHPGQDAGCMVANRFHNRTTGQFGGMAATIRDSYWLDSHTLTVVYRIDEDKYSRMVIRDEAFVIFVLADKKGRRLSHPDEMQLVAFDDDFRDRSRLWMEKSFRIRVPADAEYIEVALGSLITSKCHLPLRKRD